MQAVYGLKPVAQVGEPGAAGHGVAVAQFVMAIADVFYAGFPAQAFADAPNPFGVVNRVAAEGARVVAVGGFAAGFGQHGGVQAATLGSVLA